MITTDLDAPSAPGADNSPAGRGPLLEELLRFLVPLAAFAATASFAARELDPAGGAESAYLAVLAAAVLLAATALAPRPGVEAAAGSVLAAAAVWALPPGPGRGAAVAVVLTATLAVAAARRLGGVLPDLPLPVAVPLSLSVQFLLRGELLFDAEASARTLVALLALPVAGGIATAVLARHYGGHPALLAAGSAVLVGPGWNVLTTLALTSLAAGDLLARRDLSKTARVAAALVLLAPIAWKPWPGLAAATAGLALAWPVPALALPLGALAVWLLRPGMALGEPRDAFLLVLLLPALLWIDRRQVRRLLVVLFLAASPWLLPERPALAAPLALAALLLRRDGPAAPLQKVWTGMLLLGTALLASYPWLREAPVLAVLGLLGLTTEPFLSWVPALAAAALAAFGLWRERRPEVRLLPSFLLAGLVFAVLLIRLPRPGTLLLPPETAVRLDATYPSRDAALPAPAHPVGSLVVESALANGAGLENGTPVAVFRLSDPAGRSVSWTLRAGEGTGEWAARRPDVERTARLRSPEAWVSWVAGDFFAQRFRSRWDLDRPGRFTRLRVERAPGLPPEVSLAVHQVEVRP
ncbi:MAG TPA: hypothetical protein VEL74_03820 [Thermoanaerobaculia bacterium]|nr:hypothetical protein [Thermoanaerobaculia bacterium]